ncbi:MAG TPA: CidA/LrgA family protein [Myxococcaceae bacterium]|nr:CidA/LrgA family protein [Myxococcaceae bacterium]
MLRTALQLVLLGALFTVCRWAVVHTGLPLPAGLVALLLLMALLLTRALPERAVGSGADALLRILPPLFLPPGIGIVRELHLLHGHALALAASLVGSLLVGQLVAGVVAQAAVRREGR